MAQKALAQVYCLAGPSQTGKRTITRWVASELLNVSVDKLAQHPDFYYLERASDPETGKLKKDLSVAQARELKARLQNRPWLGGYQVVIIDEVELMNAEAGNALLKILEEPPEKTVLFLLTENDGALLPTIRSRCQIIQLGLVDDETIARSLGYARDDNEASKSDKPVFDPGDIEKVMPLAWGRPGRAIDFLKNPEALENVESEIERWQRLQGKAFYEQIALIENAFGDKNDAVRGREKLADILEVWMMQSRQSLLAGADKSIVATIDYLTEARKLLQQNVHPKLIMEQAVLRM